MVASSVSAWLIVAVTMERLGAVSLPHKAKVLFTRKRSYISIAAIAAFFFIFYTRIILTFGIVKILPANSSNVDDGMEETLNNKTYFVSPSDKPVVVPDEQLAMSILQPRGKFGIFSHLLFGIGLILRGTRVYLL